MCPTSRITHYHESVEIHQRIRYLEAPTRVLYGGLESEMGLKFGKIDESFETFVVL